MKISRNLLHAFISLNLLLGVTASPAFSAQTTEFGSEQDAPFRNIEQPLLRIGLSLGGFALVGILISSAIESSQAESVGRKQESSLDQNPL